MEEKNKLLSSNPALLQLYKDLVMTEVVTSEEFWAQHASQYMQAQKGQTQEIGMRFTNKKQLVNKLSVFKCFQVYRELF